MGKKITTKQSNFDHGMQSELRNKNLTSQSQVLGASKVKHFDIYNSTNLRPVPSLERYNTDLEKAYEIGVIGGTDTVYGLGKSMSNWYGSAWDCRLPVSPATNTDVSYTLVNLSVLGLDFWDNVNSDGSDIRFTTQTVSDSVQYSLIDFNYATNTGWCLVNLLQHEDMFIYFCNPDAGTPPVFKDYDLRRFYAFEDTQNYGDINEFTLEAGFTTTDHFIEDSLTSLVDVEGDFAGTATSNQNVSLLYSPDSLSNRDIFRTDSFRTDLTSSGLINFYIDTVTGSSALQSVTPLVTGNDYHLTFSYDSGSEEQAIFINGVKDASVINTGGGNLESGGQSVLRINGASSKIDLFVLDREPVDTAQALAQYNQYFTPSFYTIGTLQNKSDVTLTFEGSQVYQKNTDWVELEVQGLKVRSDKDPIYSIVEKEGSNYIFLTRENIGTSGYRIYGNVVSTFDGIINETQIGQGDNDLIQPVYAFGADKNYYLSVEDELEGYDNGVWSDGVYSAFPNIASMTNYGYNIALAGTQKNRNTIEIWDLLGLDPTTVIDTGTGKQKIIANIKGSLVGVHDNFISDEFKSYGQPTMDIKVWEGRDNYNTIQSFKYDYYNPTILDPGNSIINNNRTDLNQYSVFHAEPSLADMGMWALGKNKSSGQFGVSIPFDTSSIGRITQHHAIGNNIVMITEDFEHWNINKYDTYTQTSTFESMIIDCGVPNVKKDLNKIEITLDRELPAGQTITAYYRVEEQDAWTKVFEFNESGEKTWLGNQDFTDKAFNSFHELQLKFETVGGNAEIVEWVISAEYEEEE